MTEPNPSQPEEILRIAAKGEGTCEPWAQVRRLDSPRKRAFRARAAGACHPVPSFVRAPRTQDYWRCVDKCAVPAIFKALK